MICSSVQCSCDHVLLRPCAPVSLLPLAGPAVLLGHHVSASMDLYCCLLLVVVLVLDDAITMLVADSDSAVQQATGSVAKASVVYRVPTLCYLQGIDSGQRQLIAVTCIAEHA